MSDTHIYRQPYRYCRYKTSGIQFAVITFACSTLLQSCANDSIEKIEAERLTLRTKLHNQIAVNTTPNNRESWEIVAAGSKRSDGNIRLFYRQNLINEAHRASGSNQNQADYWNREHIWPQSYGIRGTSAARDHHNIVPVDRTVNTSRGNKFFDMAKNPHKECLPCKVSKDSWEPPDAVKGDVARVLFYMDVRYDGSDDVPDLGLSDSPDKERAVFGRLSSIISWHCNDPVSEEEKRRNDAVEKAQGNRNVFIDSPELAETIFAFDCDKI